MLQKLICASAAVVARTAWSSASATIAVCGRDHNNRLTVRWYKLQKRCALMKLLVPQL